MCCFIATRLMTGPIAEFFVLIAILFFLPAVLAFFAKEESERKPGGKPTEGSISDRRAADEAR